MANQIPFVLQALGILGLEQVLKLSEVLHAKQAPLKKAAGEDLIVWEDPPEKVPKKQSHPQEAKVLSFPKKAEEAGNFLRNQPQVEEEAPSEPETADDGPKLLPTDLLLWQREMAREKGEAIQKLDAMKGYQKSTQMYVVKTQTPEGKEKLRFASTNGILVNKKQA